jgi:hypothetical protein
MRTRSSGCNVRHAGAPPRTPLAAPSAAYVVMRPAWKRRTLEKFLSGRIGMTREAEERHGGGQAAHITFE